MNDQILLCTAGSGWYQAEGEDPVSMEPGTVVGVPAGTKTGTAPRPTPGSPTSPSSAPGEDVSNEWLKPVTYEVYGSCRAAAASRRLAAEALPAMRIKPTVKGIELAGTLGEGAAARDFAALLPLTLAVKDSNGRDRVGDLLRPLDRQR